MNKRKKSYKGILTSLIILLSIIISNAQERISLSLGAGFSEGLNIGARYQLKQAQVGLGVSPFLNNYFIISGSFYKHVFGNAKLSDRKPWFVKFGTSYSRSVNNSSVVSVTWHDAWANLYFGRDINFSKKFGCSLATGVVSRFYSKAIRKIDKRVMITDHSSDYGRNTFVSLGAEFNLFYRFLGK